MFSNRTYSGSHLITDVMRIRGKYDIDIVELMMLKICDDFDFNVLKIVKHQFGENPKAFTILLLLSESHFSAHSYPEADAIAFDLYTCGDVPHTIMNYIAMLIKEQLMAERDETQIVRRRLIPGDTLKWELKCLEK